jgi:ferritin-like protein
MDKEFIANIRNKLQAPITALELISQSKEVPKEFIEAAKRDLNGVVELLSQNEGESMTTKYGYPITMWTKAKEEMKEVLIERAKMHGLMPYSELVEKIKSIELEPESYALATMLGEVSAEEDTAGRGMLTVIVVHKTGDQQPGPGFFDLAKELGRDTKDILKCWVEELNKVYAYWSVTSK